MNYGGWSPYVPVAKRRERAAREIRKLQKKGKVIEPIEVQGRKIARTFWGQAWCAHLETFSDYENRVPRGRTYVRNGSVCHLAISTGKIEAIVSGSKLYRISITIAALPEQKWEDLRKQCIGHIGSMLELLQGQFSGNVMAIVTDQTRGLFPRLGEITLACNCPDRAVMCKHVAAALYGVGARLDHQPELLFLLRNVDHEQLITTELDGQFATDGKGSRRRLAGVDLGDVFGIDLEEPATPVRRKRASRQKTVRQDRPGENVFTPTAAAVTQLRQRFGMNTAQFARLVGISPPTVTRWENAGGKLNLRPRTRDALNRVAEHTRAQAMKALAGIDREPRP